MAEVTVKLNSLRTAPRKVRQVIGLVRGADVTVALNQLAVLPKRAADPVKKLLESAVAAAKDKEMSTTNLKIVKATCDQGPALKRRRLNSRGRSSLIKKFFSHITITVSDVETKGRKAR